MNEKSFLIGLIIVAVGLIVSGIIGIIKKKLHTKNLFLNIVFIPIGILGALIRYFAGDDEEIERGTIAITSGVAVISLGVLILFVPGYAYLSSEEIINQKILMTAGYVLLVSIIFILIGFIVYSYKTRKKEQKIGKK